MKFRQFCKIKEAFGKKKGETVNWLKVANVGTYGGRLVETATMHETTEVLDWGTLTVYENGWIKQPPDFCEPLNVKIYDN